MIYLLLGGKPCVFFLLGKGFVFISLFWICIVLLDLHTVHLHTVCCVLWGLNLCQHLFGHFARSHLTAFRRDPHTGNVLFSRERQFRLLEQCLHPEPFTQGDRIIYCLVVHPVFFLLGKGFVFILLFWICIALLDLHTVHLHTVYVCVWCKFVSAFVW